VYLQMGTLMARAFDAKAMRATGPAVALVEQVAHSVEAGTEALVSGSGQYAVSATGTLLYLAGGVAHHPRSELVAIDRRGRAVTLPGEASEFNLAPVVSPDGLKAAVPTRGFSEFGLWIVDLERGTKTRIVSEGEIFWPKWTPDGQRVAFTWRARETAGLGWVSTDAPDAPERLVAAEASGSMAPLSWLPGGKVLAVNVLQPNGNRDISTISLDDAKRTLAPLVRSDADEINGAFSPDGRWFAYTSDETGRYEVFIQSYPTRGPRLLASTSGGSNPVWNPNGRELFFVGEPDREGRRWLMSASFVARPKPDVGSPRPLFEVTFAPGRAGAAYDVFPDGNRFLLLRPLPSPPAPSVTEINLVANWFEELKAKVPAGGAK
jgi:Tol biopolymer transport system component